MLRKRSITRSTSGQARLTAAFGRNKKVKNRFYIRFFQQDAGGYVQYNTLQPALPGFGGY